MARIRSVHPGIFTDEAFVSVPMAARILFIGVWTEADDLGCFEWKPVTLKMRVLPVDNVDTAALLADLKTANMVMRYSVNGKEYGAIRNFCRFQRPKKPKSVHPITDEVRLFVGSGDESSEQDEDEGGSSSAPPKPQPTPVPKKAELALVQASPVPPKPEIAPQMEDGGDKRKEEREEENRSLRSLPQNPPKTDPFDEWWQAYPRKVGKDDARKAYAKAIKRGAAPNDLLDAVSQQQWQDERQFIPHPATWLNGGRWQDDPDAAAPSKASGWDLLEQSLNHSSRTINHERSRYVLPN